MAGKLVPGKYYQIKQTETKGKAMKRPYQSISSMSCQMGVKDIGDFPPKVIISQGRKLELEQ